MANNNKALSAAGQAKKDEFYTQLVDIENELRHYKEHFKGKVVFCNCDDPYESNFFKYFAINFNHLGLKKLICTCYAGSPVVYTQRSLFGDEEVIGEEPSDKKPYKIEITHVDDLNGDGAVDLTDVELLLRSVDGKPTLLKGDGDFRSAECIELLKEADIVVTNPPFSLFREYVAQLVAYDKKFIIIGNQNAITYKEIFPLFKENRLWLGYGFKGNVGFFINTHYEDYAKSSQHKEGMIRVSGVMWYTNIDIDKRHENLVLYRSFSTDEYPHYSNYDAVDVRKTADIPFDYYGVMGVPVTFMDKFNPEQFEIIGCADYTGKYGSDDIGVSRIGEEWIAKYREQGGRGHYTANMTSLVYYDTNGKACNTFKRILIRRKK
ncbi:adenine-specific methyltransferase EcoRI family protein [Ruminococcus flavefaciens]|uniref:adenine-specific methyltransferase EcoRI family protein n=1 Tax=Ruminococcus flavefaciens TaxID=1265 RepID=UPI0026ED0ACE|nr:adenine-specific methyltransferase EcoRI family protein [Ruminococcus flavefaciens]